MVKSLAKPNAAPSIETLSRILVNMRGRAGLTQAQLAARMATTQTAIARLESGRQSPNLTTLQNYAHATGYCLEIGFIRSAQSGQSGSVMVLDHHKDVIAAASDDCVGPSYTAMPATCVTALPGDAENGTSNLSKVSFSPPPKSNRSNS